jgi:hypothetical protein
MSEQQKEHKPEHQESPNHPPAPPSHRPEPKEPPRPPEHRPVA